MKIIKGFFSILLCFILILSAMVFQISMSLNHDLFSSKLYIDKINKSKIYIKLEKSINSTFSSYASKYKLPSACTSDLISPEWIQQQSENVVTGMIDYMSRKSDVLPVVETKSISDKFESNATKVLAANNIPVDRTVKNAKTEFLKSLQEIPFSSEWTTINGDNLKDNINPIRKYLPFLKIAIVASAFIAVAAILLLLLTSQSISSWKLWAGYSLIVGGLIPPIGAFILSNTSLISDTLTSALALPKDSILPISATISLLTDISDSVIMGVSKFGFIIVFIGLAIITIVSIFDNRKDNVFWYKHKPLK